MAISASIRQMAACNGLSGEVSLAKVFSSHAKDLQPRSLLQLVYRLMARRINLNVIRVGSDQFTKSDGEEINAALERLRDILDQVAMGVDRIEHYYITTAEAGGQEIINDDAEAEALTNNFAVNNDAIDVFFVREYLGATAGIALEGGPCNKNATEMTGVVVEVATSAEQTARTLAHEIGHFLGLPHSTDPTNLMIQSKNATSVTGSQKLTAAQGSVMTSHCAVRSLGCRPKKKVVLEPTGGGGF